MVIYFEGKVDKQKRIYINLPHVTKNLLKMTKDIELEKGDIVRGEIKEIIKLKREKA